MLADATAPAAPVGVAAGSRVSALLDDDSGDGVGSVEVAGRAEEAVARVVAPAAGLAAAAAVGWAAAASLAGSSEFWQAVCTLQAKSRGGRPTLLPASARSWATPPTI